MSVTKELQEQKYRDLNKRLETLRQTRAVMLSKEEDKAKERKDLTDQLTALGIDLSKPHEEMLRLQQEIAADYQRQEALVNKFEQELLAGPKVSTSPTPPNEVKTEVATPAATADDLDLT